MTRRLLKEFRVLAPYWVAALAVALVGVAKGMVDPPVQVHTRSGETLTIYFDATEELPDEVYMEGEATLIYQGQLWEEALDVAG